MTFKTERDWKDIDTASKTVMAIFLVLSFGMGYGLWNEAMKAQQNHNNIIKSQIERPCR